MADFRQVAPEPSSPENGRSGGGGGDDRLCAALRSGRFVLRASVLCYGWFVVAMAYYGLSLNAASLAPGDAFLNFLLVALVEAPGYLLSYFTMEKCGRR